MRLPCSKEQLTPLSYYVSEVKAKKYGFKNFFGPEVFAGIYLAEKYPEQTFVFIKQAVGGTSLYGAWNANWHEASVKQIQQQLTAFKNKSQNYRLLGLLWMQGETNARMEVSAKTYQSNLHNLIKAYRHHLNNQSLAVVVGEINMISFQYKQGVHVIREGVNTLAKSDKYVTILPTSLTPTWIDYPKHSDNTHYITEGQKRLGHKFSELLDNLVEI